MSLGLYRKSCRVFVKLVFPQGVLPCKALFVFVFFSQSRNLARPSYQHSFVCYRKVPLHPTAFEGHPTVRRQKDFANLLGALVLDALLVLGYISCFSQ